MDSKFAHWVPLWTLMVRAARAGHFVLFSAGRRLPSAFEYEIKCLCFKLF